MNKTFGMILIVLGVVALAWGGFTYTTQDKVLDIGPLQASVEKTHSIPLSPVAGALAVIGGLALVLTAEEGVMLILLLILVLLFGGGGGYYGHSRWGPGGGAGVGLGTILIVLLIAYMLGLLR